MIVAFEAVIQPLEREITELVEKVFSGELETDDTACEIDLAPKMINLHSENLLAK